MKIQSLKNTSFDIIYRAFSKAFSEYEVQINSDQLQAMLKRRGYNPELSFAAFDNDDIVAFTLNGTGIYNGISTAYDTGTGTMKEYRGQGLATKVFEFSIPFLKESNIEQYLLEVLQHNTKAVSVYRNLGFETTREFNYFVQQNDLITQNTNITISCAIEQTTGEILHKVSAFHDFEPSWQNSTEAILRSVDNFIFLGAYVNNDIVGYCVCEPASGDITRLAVDEHFRRNGIASELLKNAIGQSKHHSLKVVNTDIHCSSITGFLLSKNIELKGKQFEMIRPL